MLRSLPAAWAEVCFLSAYHCRFSSSFVEHTHLEVWDSPTALIAKPTLLFPPPAACLPGTPSCDPLVVKLLLSNTDYGTLSQYLFAELASQLGLQSNQFQISAVTAGAGREFNVTFYILPVSGFNISAPVAQNVSTSLSTHAVQLDQALFGNYTFFYAVPNSALEIAPTSPPGELLCLYSKFRHLWKLSYLIL